MQPDNLPPLRREVCYVSGPYRASTPAGIWANIMRARDVAMDLWRMGLIAICPHLNTMLFDGIRKDDDWLQGDIEILRRCDMVVLVPGWRDSQGARAEVAEARRLGLPVYEWVGPGDIQPQTQQPTHQPAVSSGESLVSRPHNAMGSGLHDPDLAGPVGTEDLGTRKGRLAAAK